MKKGVKVCEYLLVNFKNMNQLTFYILSSLASDKVVKNNKLHK